MKDFILIFLLLLTTAATAETVEHLTTAPLVLYDTEMFHLNPAAAQTKKTTLQGIVANGSDTATYEQQDGQRSKTDTTSGNSIMGLGVLTGFSGGAVFGASFSQFEKKDKTTTDGRSADERFTHQTFAGKTIIELTKEISVGIKLWLLQENVDIVGSVNSAQERIRYQGLLTGYTAGGMYRGESFKAGAAYQAPSRGKARILHEDRLISEAGYSYFHMQFEKSKILIGASYTLWFYRPDERRQTTTSESGNNQIQLTGVRFDRYRFTLFEAAAGIGYRPANEYAFSATYHYAKDVFVFNAEQLPTGDETENTMTHGALRAQFSFDNQMYHANVGFLLGSRSKTFDSRTRNAKYEGRTELLYGSAGLSF